MCFYLSLVVLKTYQIISLIPPLSLNLTLHIYYPTKSAKKNKTFDKKNPLKILLVRLEIKKFIKRKKNRIYLCKR